jgi:hypothetical protein
MIRAVGYEKAKHGEVERIALINESRGMSTSETRLICLINDASATMGLAQESSPALVLRCVSCVCRLVQIPALCIRELSS